MYRQPPLQPFLESLDALIESKHMLKTPFYQAWSCGHLSKECLQGYAKDYYHHVKEFSTYLSGLHAHTEDVHTRKELLNNLIEEEAGHPNHPDLWKSFCLHLGVTEEELNSARPSNEMQHVISTFRTKTQKGSVAEGIAALYAYESQIPAICVSKIEGLKTHYKMMSPEQWHYFTIHIEADKEHAHVERNLLIKHVCEKNISAVMKAAETVLDSLWNFLASLLQRYQFFCTSK